MIKNKLLTSLERELVKLENRIQLLHKKRYELDKEITSYKATINWAKNTKKKSETKK